MQFLKTQAAGISSYPPETLRRDRRYRVWHRLLLARLPIHSLWFRLVGIWHIWRAATRSCRGRIELQSPTERLDVGVGSAFVRDQAGDYQVNTRTLARAACIENLSATYPWADIVDFRIFLMGFDAGEQWTLGTKDSEPEKPTQSVS